jgi:WD40 repeat protein
MISIAFSPNSKLLASGCVNGTIKLWDALTGELKHTLEDFMVVESLAFSHDGQVLASSSSSHTTLWDTATGEPNRTLEDELCDDELSMSFSDLGFKSENFTAQSWQERDLSDPAKSMNKPFLQEDRWVAIRGQREL